MGVQLPRSSPLSGHEDCWLLPRRRTLPRLGTLAAAMFPGVTSSSDSSAPRPGISSQPGLGSSHTPSVPVPRGRIGCTHSSTLGPKMASHGGAATLKQPWIGREDYWWLPSRRTWPRLDPCSSHVAGCHVPAPHPGPSSQPGFVSSNALSVPSPGLGLSGPVHPL